MWTVRVTIVSHNGVDLAVHATVLRTIVVFQQRLIGIIVGRVDAVVLLVQHEAAGWHIRIHLIHRFPRVCIDFWRIL